LELFAKNFLTFQFTFTLTTHQGNGMAAMIAAVNVGTDVVDADIDSMSGMTS
jgi:pyruvate carboxylase